MVKIVTKIVEKDWDHFRWPQYFPFPCWTLTAVILQTPGQLTSHRFTGLVVFEIQRGGSTNFQQDNWSKGYPSCLSSYVMVALSAGLLWPAPNVACDSEHFVVTMTELSTPTGIYVVDDRPETSVNEAWFSCLRNRRLSLNKNEPESKHNLSRQAWIGIIDKLRLIHSVDHR